MLNLHLLSRYLQVDEDDMEEVSSEREDHGSEGSEEEDREEDYTEESQLNTIIEVYSRVDEEEDTLENK